MENEFIDFTRFATEQTDKELIRIVTTERDSFHPLAVDAAEKELKERKIDILVHGVKRKEVIAEKIVDSNLVGINLRFINLLIDITVWLLISMLIIIVFTNPNEKYIVFLLFVLTFVSYYSIMEISFQKTIGKFVTKTKVVRINGDKP